MPKILSGAQVEQYRSDGFAFPVPVLDAAEVRALRAELRRARGRSAARETRRLLPAAGDAVECPHCGHRFAR
jgi:hypothetical protein